VSHTADLQGLIRGLDDALQATLKEAAKFDSSIILSASLTRSFMSSNVLPLTSFLNIDRMLVITSLAR
jgi:hypothetical protein